MRFLLFTLFLAALSYSPFVLKDATAQELELEEPSQQQPEQPEQNAILPDTDDVPLATEQTKTEAEIRVNELFAQLKKTRRSRPAKKIADNIWGEWFSSGSASIDLLMVWSNSALAKKNYNIALDYLDQVVTLLPDYAEGWNRRATLHFTMNNYNKSMADIQKALNLEPRHFGALSGMAIILEQSGNKEAALNAWKRALEVYPAMKSGQEALIRLSDELEGDPA